MKMYYDDYGSIVNNGIGEILYLLKKISEAQKPQKATLFILVVFIYTKNIKSDSLHRYFYPHKKQLSSS